MYKQCVSAVLALQPEPRLTRQPSLGLIIFCPGLTPNRVLVLIRSLAAHRLAGFLPIYFFSKGWLAGSLAI